MLMAFTGCLAMAVSVRSLQLVLLSGLGFPAAKICNGADGSRRDSRAAECYLPSPPVDVTHDSHLLIINTCTVVALSSLSDEIL